MMILRKEWRDVMLEHIDGSAPISINDGHRMRTLNACVDKGWLRLGSDYRAVLRPKFSYITEKGRVALCRHLAEWAEVLVRQQTQRFDHKFSESADLGLSPGVLEPAE